ncbi:MAG: HPP family protein [Halarcobacter sp.]
MFAIYNNSGLNFRSTIDNLYNLPNLDAIARVRNNVEEGLPKDHTLKNKKKLYDSKDNKKAEAIYKKIANIDTKAPIYNVSEIMTNDVISLNESNTLQEAYNLMEEHDINQIPVLNNENTHIMGMITYKMILDILINDIEFVEFNLNKTLDNLDFTDVLTTDPITDIRRVAKVMVDFKLGAIPIVDQDDKLQGIVSRSDILDAVSNKPPMQIYG